MGFFDKLFGKQQAQNTSETAESTQFKRGNTFISTDETTGYKMLRELTEEQKNKIEASIILVRTGQLYTHYWTDQLVCTDRNDPEWQNKIMFFWKAEEPFPKKYLPPSFETYKVKYFLFRGDTSTLSVKMGQAMPWFGMPGLGEKHVCEINNEQVTVPELQELNFVEYVEQVELTDKNLEILIDKENYFFLIDERITTFYNGNFYFEGKPIPISLVYSLGGIHIIKTTTLD